MLRREASRPAASRSGGGSPSTEGPPGTGRTRGRGRCRQTGESVSCRRGRRDRGSRRSNADAARIPRTVPCGVVAGEPAVPPGIPARLAAAMIPGQARQTALPRRRPGGGSVGGAVEFRFGALTQGMLESAAMQPLKICFVSSEVHPFSKTGGLADVSSALSLYLSKAGHDVRVFTPLYSRIETKGREFRPVESLRNIPV